MYLNGDIIEFDSLPGWEWEISIENGKQIFIPDSNIPNMDIMLKLPAEATEQNSKLKWRSTPRYAKIK